MIQAKMALSQVRLPLDSKWFGYSIKTQPVYLSTCRFLGAYGWDIVLLSFERPEFPFLVIHFMQVKNIRRLNWLQEFGPEGISVSLCTVQHTVHTPDVTAVQ